MSRYIRNTESGEVHVISDQGRSLEVCNLDAVRKASHADEISEDEMLAELQEHPDRGCAHCMKAKEAGDGD